jgi:hypothetical protein
MKFSLEKMPENVRCEIKVGNVYTCRAGRSDSPRFWIIVSMLKSGGCILLGINHEGEIIGATRYAEHAVKKWPLVGFCKEAESMVLSLEIMK